MKVAMDIVTLPMGIVMVEMMQAMLLMI